VGEHGLAATTVELSGAATLGDVAKSVEAAKTPHSAKCAPGIAAAVAKKLSAEQTEALLKTLQEK